MVTGAAGSLDSRDEEMVVVGRITGAHGVKGWVRVHSFTDPPENILHYRPWYLLQDEVWCPVEHSTGSGAGRNILARIPGCADRDGAMALRGADIAIRRSQLPETAPEEYYWRDLIGLQVVTVEAKVLGTVDHLIATGSNDVLVVKGERERLIPFLTDSVIVAVDLVAGRIEVDWDPDF
jgi:16S rRNA processing protein RimM